MSFLSNFLLAVGVSMDSFAVAMSRSTIIRLLGLMMLSNLLFFSGEFRL